LDGHREAKVKDRAGKVTVRGVCGSYLNFLDFMRNGGLTHGTPTFNGQGKTTQRKCILWLGSSVTNMHLPEATNFLGRFATGALKAGDTFLVGVDHCRDIKKVKAAYSEESDCWKAYIRNGVKNAGAILGGDAAVKMNGGSNWEYVTRWDRVNGRHMVCATATEPGPDFNKPHSALFVQEHLFPLKFL
jgi:uncharacterized SAM-dependent methyltransferase